MKLPECHTLLLEPDGEVLRVTLNRPIARNAMSIGMVRELVAVFRAVESDVAVRAIVLSGAGGNFCAGADIKDLASARPRDDLDDPFARLNREFGYMLARVNAAPQVVVAVLEGTVLGGGIGLVCVADVVLAREGATFGLPETGLGVPPAQILGFVVQRVGLPEARRLALTGRRLDAAGAARIGLVDEHYPDEETLMQGLRSTLTGVKRCAPRANAVTKRLLLDAGVTPEEDLLDRAALAFSDAARGPEGQEGMRAFVEKRPPRWSSE